jgi:hypothetical protein
MAANMKLRVSIVVFSRHEHVFKTSSTAMYCLCECLKNTVYEELVNRIAAYTSISTMVVRSEGMKMTRNCVVVYDEENRHNTLCFYYGCCKSVCDCDTLKC